MKYLEVKDKIKIGLLILLLIGAIIIFPKFDSWYSGAESYFLSKGPLLSALIYFALVILSIIISPLPFSPLVVISGAVFGPYLGFVYTMISSTIGAAIAFLIGRFLLKSYFDKKFHKNKWYRRLIEEEDKKIIYFIFITRIIPQAPFDVISYFSGITSVKLWKFSLATFLGLIPLVLILTFFGKLVEPYRVMVVFIFFVFFIIYYIFNIIKTKRYYVKGY